MTRQPETVDATFFVQLKPRWSQYYSVDPALLGATVKNVTQNRPKQPEGGTVTVKLTLRLPAGAFLPLRPEATVVIPEAFTLATPVEVTVQDPS